jgi:hypothetical protein
LLADSKWQEADRETLTIMLRVAGREKEGWLDIQSINSFPCTELRTIDRLWLRYSNGQFGFSVQKRIWESIGGTLDADYETWCKFGDRVGWRSQREFNFTFDIKVPHGHLPTQGRGKKRQKAEWMRGLVIPSIVSRLLSCNI